jgi:hypothetical protein
MLKRPQLLLLAAAAMLLGGCAQRYAITLNNGATLMSRGRPKLDDRGFYVFKDATGREQRVSELRVIQIEAQ